MRAGVCGLARPRSAGGTHLTAPRSSPSRPSPLRAGKQLLDALKRDGETLVKTNPRSDRIQPYKAQYMRLCKLYVDAVKDHQKAKETLRKVQTDDLVRRGMILYGDTKSEAEIRSKVEQDPANFVREAIMEEAADEAQAAYAEAQSRARDVEFLVKSLGEVAAMFQDLAVLVQQQSEMLDSIETNVETAGKYVRKGNEAVRGGDGGGGARACRERGADFPLTTPALPLYTARAAAQRLDRVPEEDAQVLLLLHLLPHHHCRRDGVGARRRLWEKGLSDGSRCILEHGPWLEGGSRVSGTTRRVWPPDSPSRRARGVAPNSGGRSGISRRLRRPRCAAAGLLLRPNRPLGLIILRTVPSRLRERHSKEGTCGAARTGRGPHG